MLIDWRNILELPDVECPIPTGQGAGKPRGAIKDELSWTHLTESARKEASVVVFEDSSS
jgi:hypothetical protein